MLSKGLRLQAVVTATSRQSFNIIHTAEGCHLSETEVEARGNLDPSKTYDNRNVTGMKELSGVVQIWCGGRSG